MQSHGLQMLGSSIALLAAFLRTFKLLLKAFAPPPFPGTATVRPRRMSICALVLFRQPISAFFALGTIGATSAPTWVLVFCLHLGTAL
jgi:hypothetical protein